MKLSKAQKEVIWKMRDGWRLLKNVVTKEAYLLKLTKRIPKVEGVHTSTFKSLAKRGLIGNYSPNTMCHTWILTPLGKTIEL